MSPTPPAPKAYSYIRFSTLDLLKHSPATEAAEQWAAWRGVELDSHSYRDLRLSAFREANAETTMLEEFLAAIADGLVAPGSFLLIEHLELLYPSRPTQSLALLGNICDQGVTVVMLADGREYTSFSITVEPWTLLVDLAVAFRAHEESVKKLSGAASVASSTVSTRLVEREEDCLAILESWMGDGAHLKNTGTLRYSDLDKKLSLKPGSAKLYLPKASKRWGYRIAVAWGDEILLRHTDGG